MIDSGALTAEKKSSKKSDYDKKKSSEKGDYGKKKSAKTSAYKTEKDYKKSEKWKSKPKAKRK